MNIRYSTCFLFTKQFPFHHAETYIFNEVPYLTDQFERVIIVPYDEHGYKKSRIEDHPRVTIFPINKKIRRFNHRHKLQRSLSALSWWIKEITTSREKIRGFQRFSYLFRLLQHQWAEGHALAEFIEKENIPIESCVFYHYWTHHGLLIQMHAEKFLRKRAGKTVSRGHAIDLYHSNWPSIQGKPNYLPFEKIKFHRLDEIFSISEHGVNHLAHNFPFLKGKLYVSRLGVYPPKQLPSLPEYPKEQVKTLITCSNLTYRKRIFMMPEIIQAMKTPVKWIHLGGDAQPKELESLRNTCKEKNINAWIPGNKSQEEVHDILLQSNAALFCNLSLAEGIPVSLMEAALYGIPMLATDGFGNVEIVNDENGIIIPVIFNSDQVAAKIDSLITDELQWKKASVNARKICLDLYSAERNYRQFFDELVK